MKFKPGDKIICIASYGMIKKGETFIFIQYNLDEGVFFVRDKKVGVKRFGYQNINKYKLYSRNQQMEFDFE